MAVSSMEKPGQLVALDDKTFRIAADGAALHLDWLRMMPGAFNPEMRDRLIAGLAIPAH